MANQRLQYTIAFTADTDQAKRQLNSLQNDLKNLINTSGSNQPFGLTKELAQATSEAAKLKAQLTMATDVNTGKLDLVKFNHSLKQGGGSLEKVRMELSKLGPQGEQSFRNLAAAITNAETPMLRLSAGMKKLGETFANTIRWQISSTALNALVGSVQSAYRYAQDLDKSLNNIRIVTEKSTDQMAKFAVQANKAAKSLSTTTTAYTDAALIYYQQGLTDDEVLERTNATVKMANVTGENAEHVSSYMTAIWNNFDNGSKSLEYYADVITALGAATAASSEEIAGGLEKFAAVAETVGLSYEYATSALTTIIDTTRQSEDVVGTSLKTIFARLQGVALGETLDDGVNLNKYSKALETAGVQVLDQNNQLRTMDEILNDLGNRWDSLSKTQQVALAQTVGGVRQYTQLIALMDNWDKFQQNVNIANLSEGALNTQSEIYEESWEASVNRVKASLESIYDTLIDEEFFIGLNDTISKILDVVNRLIKSFGGFKGILFAVSGLFLNLFSNQVAEKITNVAISIQSMTKSGRKAIMDLKAEAAEALTASMGPNNDLYTKQRDVMNEYLLISKDLTKEQDLQVKQLIEQHQLLVNNAVAAREQVETTREDLDNSTDRIRVHRDIIQTRRRMSSESVPEADRESYNRSWNLLRREARKNNTNTDNENAMARELSEVFAKKQTSTTFVSKLLRDVDGKNASEQKEIFQSYKNSMKEEDWKSLTEGFGFEFQEVFDAMPKRVGEAIKELQKKLDNEIDANVNLEAGLSEVGINTEEIVQNAERYADSMRKSVDKTKELDASTKNIKNTFDKIKTAASEASKSFVGFAQGMASFASAVSSLRSLKDLWSEDNTDDALTKILSTATTLGFALPQLIDGMSKLKENASGILTVIKNPYFIGAAAIITAIAVAWKYYKANSPEEKLKKLKKEAKEASDEVSQLSGELTTLNNTIDSIKSKEDALRNLKKGTIEYKKAVLELNQQMIEFINLYDLWDKAKLVDGVWTVDDSVYEDILDAKQKELDITTQIAYQRQAETSSLDASNAARAKYGTKLDTGSANVKKEGATKSLGADSYDNKTLSSTQEEKIFSNLLSSYDKLIDENGEWIDNASLQIKNILISRHNISEEEAAQYAGNIVSNNENKQTLIQAKKEVDTQTEIAKQNSYAVAGQMATADYYDTDAGMSFIKQAGSFGVDAFNELIGHQIEEKAKEEIAKYGNVLDTVKEQYKTRFNKTDEEMSNLNDINDLKEKLAQDDALQIVKQQILNGEYGSNQGEIISRQAHGEEYKTFDTANEEVKKDLGFEIEDDWNYTTNDDRLAEQQKNLGLSDEDVNSIAESFAKTNKEIDELRNGTEEEKDLLQALVLSSEEMNIEAKKVAEGWGDISEAIKKADKENGDYAKSLNKAKVLFEKIVDTSGWDFEFMDKHRKDIIAAAEGDAKALEKLRIESAREAAKKVSEDPDIKEGAKIRLTLDDSEYKTLAEDYTSAVSTLAESAPNLEVGMELTGQQKAIDDFNTFAEGAGWSADQIQSKLSKIGYVGKIEYKGVLVDGEWKAIPYVTNLIRSDDTSIPTPKTTGSGGSKKKDKKTKSDEIERYHEIRNTIEDLNKQLDETNKKKDRAFGKGKLKAYDDEISKLNELKDAQEQYLDEIEGNLKKDKNAILKYGVKFDENGNISNYDEVMEAQLNKFNKKRTEKAEKEYEEFKKLIEQYEETHDLMLDEQAKLEELQNQIHDEGLAAAAYKVEYQIELNDDDVEFLDYLIDQLSDNVTSLVEKIALIESKMVESLDNYGIYMDGIKDIFTNLNATRDKDSQLSEEVINRIINGDFTTEDLENWGLVGEDSDLTAEDMSKLSEYRDSLLQTAKDLSDYQAAIYETISEGIEKTNAEFDKYSERLEHMFGLWEHFKNIVELTGNKYLGISKEMILALNKDAVQSKVAQVATDAENLSLLREQLKKFQDENGDFLAGEYANTESSVEELKKQYQELQAAVNEAENNLLSSWEDALSAANDLFQMSVETAIAAFEEGISGTYGSLDMLQDAYDKQKDLGDLYLDDYKQIYELSKLTRDINKSIDDTDNIASKNKLREIQQEINDLQEAGVELSQYDLDFLRAKYELRLAEIALEDAQNAKSQVRMTRDNEGNWSYTYTADQDNIDKAQQNYEDKLYAIQNLTSNYITTVEEQILALQNSMVDEMAGVDKTLYASEEEYLARLAEIQDYYTQKMDALSGQINNALGNNKEIYENDWKAYSEATDYKISANERYIDSWNETQLSLLGGYETLEDYQETFMSLLGSIDDENSLIGQLASAYRSWSDVVEQISAATGMSIDELAKKIQTIPEESQAVTDEMKAMSEEMATAWEGILQGLQDFTETLAETLQGVLDDVKDSVADLIALMKALYNYEESPDDGSSDPGSEPPPVSAASGGYTGSWGASGKLAILHEKELILNAEDTRNMLKVVGMTRDIAKQIELNAIAAGSGLSNFAPGSVGQFQQVEQNIVINADFPNASNREEIAAAFDNLLNRASQYANRK